MSLSCLGLSAARAAGQEDPPSASLHSATFRYESLRPATPSADVSAPQAFVVTGRVVSADEDEGIPGVNVIIKGTSTGTVTDIDGNYRLEVPSEESVLVFSAVGYMAREVVVGTQTTLDLTLETDVKSLEEVVVVGYGEQKRETVVAAIAQTDGKVLERSGNVQSIGAALTGNVPGVITNASTGMPGEEDPQIFIRGRSTWNNASPLILVDGVERPMSSVEISAVESVSVLKDASATAVYGVRGANGVILITTKKGKTGKATIRARVNTTMKVPSKLPGKYDAYDALRIRNQVIENELALRPESWNDYLPQAIIDKYRYPASVEEMERYPNVDWTNTLFKDYAMSYNASLNINGGTKFVKYFANADFLREGDLFRQYDNNRGYQPGYGFNRLNVRSNLDFQLTSSTTLSAGLAGSYGVRKSPWGATGNEYNMWIAAYSNAPDVFLPQYSDGSWGYYAPNQGKAENSVRSLAISGIQFLTTTRLNTNFTLDQNLDMITKGLNFKGTLALDNEFLEGDRGVSDLYNDTQQKWIDPVTGLETYKISYDANNRFDFQEGVKWTATPGTVRDYASYRRLFYQLQMNYAVTLGDKHDLTAMGLFNRNEYATGSEIPNYREDWVFRTTYAFANKYMFEYNGAYNGSEKFSKENRFAFFSSGGAGWILTNEPFLQAVPRLDFLKLRASYGEIGDDNINGRWLYLTQWAYGGPNGYVGQARLGLNGEQAPLSPYTWYREASVGNESVHWEKVKKTNFGLDYGLFNGLIKGNVDFFRDVRTDVLIAGNNRAIPSYYGTQAPVANLGRVQNQGFELEVNLNYQWGSGLRLWSTLNMTHAKDKVLSADDAGLLPDYQKAEGKQIGQAYSYVGDGFYNTWDEVYASTMHNTNDNQKLPGNYFIIDYNADGIIDSYDNVPFGFSGAPQNTYNATFGFEWKNFSGFVQFYGTNNVTRQVVLTSLSSQNHVVYDEGSYWSKDNPNADSPMPRWLSTPSGYTSGNRYMYDGSYLRLKNAEIAYTFGTDAPWVNRAGFESLRIFMNGNNLFLWTRMPDDRESNFAGTGWASQGAYPTVKRYNLGLNLTF
ncbi:TonB-linked outer membrane protein, SusC/RagA family [Catalinimonas alkaloidigena]|uniref:TonB-linked outer membrane protein, SusC/RagA family n=2 Tax=Catalinimonas alkaloidigena TaxID=1075417 RepID=A0A1G9HN35_9BACT|nr:TonB-linked outer membrane protein, SusC/RagA family [Catalinimonas alkaloidigena]